MSEPIHVLIVDDHEVFLDAMRQHAKLETNRDIAIVATAKTETEALRLVSAQPLDVVLVDMTLKGDREAGLRIITELSQRPSHPKLLAISGTIEAPEFIIRVLRKHASGYLLKEAKGLDDFFVAIRNVHRGGKEIPSNVAEYWIDGNPIWPKLTPREQEVWHFIAEGLSNQAIATELKIGIDAVKRHTTELYSKLGIANRAQATRRWMEQQYGLSDVAAADEHQASETS